MGKHIMKKFLLLILSFVLGLFAFVGCGEEEDKQYEEVYAISYYVVVDEEAAVVLTDTYKDANAIYPTSYEEGDAFTFAALRSRVEIDGFTYEFKGWYADAACTTPIDGVLETTKNDLKVYAKYALVPVTYTIAYKVVLDSATAIDLTDAYKETNGAYPATYVYGVGATIDALKTEVTVEGKTYEFKGWYKNEACSAALANNTISATNSGNVTLYAKYASENDTPSAPTEPVYYDIAYYVVVNGDDAIALTDDHKLQDGEYPAQYEDGVGLTTISALQEEITVDDGVVVFKGWYIDEACTTAFTAITADDFGDKDLYAKYETVYYNISYSVVIGSASAVTLDDSYKATGVTYPTQYEYGEVTELPDLTAEITVGSKVYEFKGWYADAACTTKLVSISAEDKEAKTVYAKYAEKVVVEDDDENWTKNY